MPKHSICHFEWSSTDLERTKSFLSGLFGWVIKPWGDNYMVFDTPEGPGGGIMKVDKVEPGKSPYIYVEVDDIDTYLEKAKKMGGGVDVPRTEIPNVGWYAHVTDHDNNIIGLLEPKSR